MAKTRSPGPPRHLGKAAKQFWRDVLRDFELDPHHVEILKAACEQLTRADQCRQILDKEGLAITDRFGQSRPHPMLQEERAAHLAFLRLRRELGLDDATSEPARGPHRGK